MSILQFGWGHEAPPHHLDHIPERVVAYTGTHDNDTFAGWYSKIGSDDNVQWGQTILATIIALTIGYLVIAWLIRWVSTHSFLPFVIYRVVLGSLLLALLATGRISAL